MFFMEEFNKKTIIQLRWALIISLGYIILFSHSGESVHVSLIIYLPIYAITNLVLLLGPEEWFQRQRFISLILLLDLSTTVLTILLTGPEDSEFYVTFFLILLISAITRKAVLVYSTFGTILLVYGVTSYFKSPSTFFETSSLLKFPFIFTLAIFLRGMVVAYNRFCLERELLKSDYQELEVLNSVALSIGQYKELTRFLFRLSSLLCEKLGLERCTAIFMDRKEDNCYMVSSDDLPMQECFEINLKNYPDLKESLKSEEVSEEEAALALRQVASRYILKKIPLSFQGNKLGTLYLRASTPKRRLTRREEYFMQMLGRITAIAILDLERSLMFDKMLGKRTESLEVPF